MTPADFREFVLRLPIKWGLRANALFSAATIWGPNCWQQENADAAMEKSVELVKAYVRAASVKFILMRQCPARDPIPLAPETVAERAAVLCLLRKVWRQIASVSNWAMSVPVPVPGGEASAIQSVHITHVEDAIILYVRIKGLYCPWADRALTRVPSVFCSRV